MKNGDNRMHVQIVSDNPDAKFTVMEAAKLPSSPERHPLERDNSAFYKLTIHLPEVEKLNLAVVFQLIEPGEKTPDFEYQYTPMNEWELSE